MPSRKPATTPAIDRIREIAYQLWLDAGQPEGQDTTHWLEAEAMIANEPAKKKAAPKKKAA